MIFEIDYSDYGRRTETQHSDNRWDFSWYENHDYEYNEARIVNKNNYKSVGLFPGEKEPQVGSIIYVVYVSYDTGDSFGQEDGLRAHLWAFTDEGRAGRLCSLISKDAKRNPKYDFKNIPLDFEGVPIPVNTWKGYFERFDYAGYVELIVNDEEDI